MPDRCDAGLALRTYAGRGGADHGQLHGTGDVNGKERKRAPAAVLWHRSACGAERQSAFPRRDVRPHGQSQGQSPDNRCPAFLLPSAAYLSPL